VQTSDDEKSFFFVDIDLVLASSVGKGRIEPFIERFLGVEDFGKDEI
jgi:hypothetical protein